MQYNVSFYFKQTGALFRKGERIYRIERKHQMEQARKACIDYAPGKEYISFETLFERLNQSAFRSRFSLKEAELNYLEEKGMETVRRHAEEFVRMRLAPAQIPNDGRQTPMKGHPVFRAQHATGTCCRGCLCKWHGIPKGKAADRGTAALCNRCDYGMDSQTAYFRKRKGILTEKQDGVGIWKVCIAKKRKRNMNNMSVR